MLHKENVLEKEIIRGETVYILKRSYFWLWTFFWFFIGFILCYTIFVPVPADGKVIYINKYIKTFWCDRCNSPILDETEGRSIEYCPTTGIKSKPLSEWFDIHYCTACILKLGVEPCKNEKEEKECKEHKDDSS
jgi:hypothetical protein